MSMAMILDAPAIRAPLTALSPTPPAPKDGDRFAGAYIRGVQDRTGARYTAAADVCIALGVISGKWKPLVFHELRSGTLRYGQRQRRMRLNLTQINLVNSPLLRMSVGGRFVFVTSHLAHFYGTGSSSPLAFQGGTPI
jgi:hypothetical protein